MPWIKTAKDGVYLSIHLNPRASRDAIDGLYGDALKIKIKAPPVDGKANAYLLAYLAKALEVPRSSVTLEHGETSREKTIRVLAMTAQQIAERLGVPLA
jgi:uncharacterized protein (TIGR00251 family)